MTTRRNAQTLTHMLAYKAMFEFLRQYADRGESEDIEALLGGMQLLADDSSADPAMKSDWSAAIAAVLQAEEDGGAYKPIRLELT